MNELFYIFYLKKKENTDLYFYLHEKLKMKW